jgi:hypothetical protein
MTEAQRSYVGSLLMLYHNHLTGNSPAEDEPSLLARAMPAVVRRALVRRMRDLDFVIGAIRKLSESSPGSGTQ